MAKLLWQPTEDQIKQSNMYRYMQFVNRRYDRSFETYDDLYRWSVDAIPDFWASIWEFMDIRAAHACDRVVDDPHKMPGAQWFEGARLNFAENLLRYRDDRTAIIFKGEERPVVRLTYAELYKAVAQTAAALKKSGVTAGDRGVGFMPNMPQTIIAMLAAVSLGATWSSCSPDFGIKGVLDRFGQIQPKVLFTASGYFFKGKKIDSLGRIADILAQLPSIEKVVVVPYTEDQPDISTLSRAVMWDDFAAPHAGAELVFEQLPFMHPIYIMYSSGTTGLPKCMVQSAGGILLHQMKELVLHTGLTREDTIFYFTTWSVRCPRAPPWCFLTATRSTPMREPFGSWPKKWA